MSRVGKRAGEIAEGDGRGSLSAGNSSNTSSSEGAKETGKLPHGWSKQRIEQLFSPLEDGRTLHQGWSPQCDKVPSPSESVWGVLKTTSIQAGEFQPEHNKLLPSELAPRPLIEVKAGDILITCAGPRVRCGVSCLVRQTRKRLMMSGKMYRFRVDAGLTDPRYVEAFLQTEQARLAIDKMKTGSSDSGLNLTHDRFRQLPIPVAPLPEQRQIVAEIEKQFTRLEAGVAALKRVQANLKRYRAAVLKAACEGRLVPTEAELTAKNTKSAKTKPNPLSASPALSTVKTPGYETGEALLARILAERRKNWQGRGKYKEPVAQATGLATLPEGWIWTTIGSCFHVAVGATPSRKEASYWGGDIPWVSSGEVRFTTIVNTRETITKVGLENSSTQLNPRGSVLLGMIGEGKTRGQTAILNIDACNNQNCAAIWVSRTIIPPKYIYYWLWSQYDNTRRTSSGNNQPALNKARIEAMFLPLPPIAEQTRIVAETERRLSVVEELEAIVSTNLQRAIRLRQSILHRAFQIP